MEWSWHLQSNLLGIAHRQFWRNKKKLMSWPRSVTFDLPTLFFDSANPITLIYPSVVLWRDDYRWLSIGLPFWDNLVTASGSGRKSLIIVREQVIGIYFTHLQTATLAAKLFLNPTEGISYCFENSFTAKDPHLWSNAFPMVAKFQMGNSQRFGSGPWGWQVVYGREHTRI